MNRPTASLIRGVALLTGALFSAATADAGARYALVVSGAAGGPGYSAQYARWSLDLSRVLVEQLEFPRENVTVLREDGPDPSSPTAANVRRVIASYKSRLQRDDLLFLVLIGHGTFDGTDARFNLVGPDLEAAEWAALLNGVAGRQVIVNTAAAGFPFLERLAAPRRIVVTATDTAEQRFDTVFPEFFIRAWQDDGADLDKNGRISLWEAFAAASTAVGRHYQRLGQLATERSLLDDTGDGVGHEATERSDDGAVASRMYLDDPPADAPPTDEVLVRLLQEKAALETEAENLRIRRRFLSVADYNTEFERIMVALAKVAQDIRARGKS